MILIVWACLSGRPWWNHGCILDVGTSVQPPVKTPHLENFTLCLNMLISRGGLTPRLVFVKLIILEIVLKLM